jgi:hypothetical protein
MPHVYYLAAVILTDPDKSAWKLNGFCMAVIFV